MCVCVSLGAWCLFCHGVGGVRSGQVGFEGVWRFVASSGPNHFLFAVFSFSAIE